MIRLKAAGIDMLDVSKKIGKMYSKMIFEEGYVHCDPHPGNVLVQKNEAGVTQIVLLDHGLYTQLTSQFRYITFKTCPISISAETRKHSLPELFL